MSDIDHKPGPRPAASYALLYPRLVESVRPLGYALTLHGSMNRDLDLVAIPWVDEAADPEAVVEAIRFCIDGYTGWDTKAGCVLPHGRRGWLIWFKGVDLAFGGGACIDLSIMPRVVGKCTCAVFPGEEECPEHAPTNPDGGNGCIELTIPSVVP